MTKEQLQAKYDFLKGAVLGDESLDGNTTAVLLQTKNKLVDIVPEPEPAKGEIVCTTESVRITQFVPIENVTSIASIARQGWALVRDNDALALGILTNFPEWGGEWVTVNVVRLSTLRATAAKMASYEEAWNAANEPVEVPTEEGGE